VNRTRRLRAWLQKSDRPAAILTTAWHFVSIEPR
jgi:hypothetical protein